MREAEILKAESELRPPGRLVTEADLVCHDLQVLLLDSSVPGCRGASTVSPLTRMRIQFGTEYSLHFSSATDPRSTDSVAQSTSMAGSRGVSPCGCSSMGVASSVHVRVHEHVHILRWLVAAAYLT